MKRFFVAIALASVLSSTVLAGDIPSVPGPQPPPQGIATSTSPGDIPSGGATEQFSSDSLSALLAALGFLTV
jgi:hypothetical protein